MNIVREISELVKQDTCLIGIGNTFRGDDGAGPYITESIKEKIEGCENFIYNVEDVFENHVFEIAEKNFGSVIIIDAVKAESPPGSIVFGRIEEFMELFSSCSTHKLPVSLCAEILRKNGKKVFLLGISAKDTDFRRGLTNEVKHSADLLKDILIDAVENRRGTVYE